ncbi:MAG: DUF3995 domain-containing protein [Pseudarcicella sp.]|jgi:hypothetical protein|nr:DUF3995 domain-containing protein [Pseudarcicella sp.]MBP6410134.1 DUF3995 domain-containing protein [Pseudarcicella sp.]
MKNLLILIDSFCLFAIAGIHFYWAMGGIKLASAVLPTNPNGTFSFKPNKLATFTVALIFALFAVIMLSNMVDFSGVLPSILLKYGTVSVSIIFLLRALGDFKYMGFSKTVKNTNFADNDSKYYSPLCLMIGAIGLMVYFLK